MLRVTPISAHTVKNVSQSRTDWRLSAAWKRATDEAHHRGNRLFVKIEMLEVERLREHGECERDDERCAEGEARDPRQVEQ